MDLATPTALPLSDRPGSAAEATPSRWGRALEFLGLFVALPLTLRWWPPPLPRLALLGVVTLGCLVVLLRDPTFDWRRLVSMRGLRSALPGLAARTAVAAALVAALAALLPHPMLRSSGASSTLPWLVGLGAYPFVSAWPQEVVYRVYFFHRFGALVGPRVLLAANALSFGLLHLVYPDLLAALLTVPVGLVLALTYRRTRAMGPVWLEHALYGTVLFSLGLGGYFGAAGG